MNISLKLKSKSFAAPALPPREPKTASAAKNEAPQPFETVTLSEAAKAHEPSPSKKGGLFQRLAKTGLMVGLAASLALGAVGCTTMTTSCGPYGCVTTEQFDPVKTAAAVGAGIIVLDAVNDAGHQGYNRGYNHGYNNGYHQNYGNYYQNNGYYNGNCNW
jgi:hypothetical protein